MPINVEIPSLGDSVTEAVLIKWLKADGDVVKAAEALAELETDKANVDIPSPIAGVLRRAKEEGDTVHVGETIARIDESGSAAATAKAPATASVAKPVAAATPPAAKPPAATPPSAATAVAKPPTVPASTSPSPKAPEDLSPATRRVVAETGIDPASVSGTGRGGRLTKEDVQSAVASGAGAKNYGNAKAGVPTDASANSGSGEAEVETAPPNTRPIAPVAPQTAGAPRSAPTALPKTLVDKMVFDDSGTKRVPMTKMRKAIARRLVEAQHTAAILTTFNEVDLTAILELRAKYKQRFIDVHGISLGLMSFFAKAVCMALGEFPRVNAEIDGDDVIYHQHVNLGIAVSTERGLAVPVLKNAEMLSFAKIESEVKRVATAVRDGKLGLEELSGGTFTITNGGVFGSLLSTPILNPPQSAILGMHAIQKRPMVVNDKVEVRQMMYVALSYDHRMVDGRESVSFLVRMKEMLEDPARLMLEI